MRKKIVIKKNRRHNELMEACRDNDFDKVRSIIESGLEIPEVWDCDSSPLFYAVINNNLSMVQYLLEHGVPPYDNAKGAHKLNPESDLADLTLAGFWSDDSHEAVMYLLEHGAAVDSHTIGYSPVMKVAKLEERYMTSKSDTFLNALMQRGVNVDIEMTYGETLLHAIVGHRNSRYVPTLVTRSRNLEAKSDAGLTPLFSALSEGSEVGIGALLEAGANPNAYFGRKSTSVLDRAYFLKSNRSDLNILGQMDRIIEKLIKHGAKTYQQLIDDGVIASG